ncbi:olfactory receptor class A-like protein 1 [Acipenser ruthenus]|uniref:olfactory receptor class A-like protein 1 n=1 Tax=Acipenser ruthenus TaxID=7906 RepID=UPI0015613D8C|nr:olfactory receptor class A-like protein 1 [Acipenser ruthenus]
MVAVIVSRLKRPMDLPSILKAVSNLLLISVGIPGNLIVLLVFGYIGCTERKLLPADSIVFMMMFVHLLIILNRGIPQTLFTLNYRGFYDSSTCKFLIYIFRMTRSMSMSLTFLLSAYQSVLIAPATSRLSYLKPKLPTLLLPSFLFLWLLNGATCIHSFLYTSQIRNFTALKFTLNLSYCIVEFPSEASYLGTGTMELFRDLFFVFFMVAASSYILFVLYRHRQQVKGIRSSEQNQHTPEMRAAKIVVTFVTLFVVFFGVDNITWIYTLSADKVPADINNVRVFFSSLYASVSPIVVIASNKKVNSKLQCTKTVKVSQSKTTIVSIA